MAEGCANRTHRRPTGLPPVLRTGRGTSPLCPPRQHARVAHAPRQLDAIEVLQDGRRILAAGAEPIPQGSNRDVALSGNFFGDDALDVLEHVAVEEDSTCDFHHQAFVAERAEDALECRPVSCSLRDFVQPRWGKPSLQQRLDDALPGSGRFRIYRWGEAWA